MREDTQDRRALIERIISSETFVSSPALAPLLKFLFEKRNARLSAEEIEEEHYKRPINSSKHDPAHSRERVAKLKKALEKYARDAANEKIKCLLPHSKRGEGYQLDFSTVIKSATELFWAAHMESGKDVRVVCNPLLFFYDHDEGRLLRFVDTWADEVTRAAAMNALKLRHEEAHTDRLMPGHFCIETGEVFASESIREWFWNTANIRLALSMSTDITAKEILSSSPILLGSVRTNKYVRRFFASTDSKGLAYRLDPERFAWLTIERPDDNEKEMLGKLGMRIDKSGNGSLQTPSAEMTLGVVARTVDPGGRATTIITSDANLNGARMAAALTDDRQLERVFDQADWPAGEALPATFEWLFLVRLRPGDLDDEAADAELVSWRMSA